MEYKLISAETSTDLSRKINGYLKDGWKLYGHTVYGVNNSLVQAITIEKITNDMKNNKELLICACHSTNHQIILLYSEDEDDNGNKYPMCYAHVYLDEFSFWYRLKYGIKYIFGYKCRYGAFDEFIFNPDDAPKLQKLVDYLNIEKETNKKQDESKGNV